MKYMGSKSRIAKSLVPFLTKRLDKDSCYVEPFAGGMNMLSHISHPWRVAVDLNRYLISMWEALVWHDFACRFPHHISRELYSGWRDVFNAIGFSGPCDFDTEAMLGWVGFMGSFNGRFFDGGYSGHAVSGRDYIGEQIRNTLAQVASLQGVKFHCSSYSAFAYPPHSVIYCDPPYEGTKQYSVSKEFDHPSFWQWCRVMSREGHDVLISEYSAPSDFTCLWSKEVTNALNTRNTYRPIEKLFVHESLLDRYL